MTAREFWARTFSRWGRRRVEDDLDEEIAAHLEMAAEENRRKGMPAEQARRAAAVRFGGVGGAKEQVWEQLRLPALDSLARDARYALRGLLRAPGFTMVAIATLALGIGICSAFLSILNGALLKTAPGIAEPDRLFATRQPVPYPFFESLRGQQDIASEAAAWIGPVTFHVAQEGTSEAPPERIRGHIVSQGYFQTLGAEPALGRFFEETADQSEVSRGVIVSHDFWRTRLGSDLEAVGRPIRVNGQMVTILGVTQPEFFGVFPSNRAQIFVPIAAGAELAPELDGGLQDAETPLVQALLRLRPGMTAKAAEAALDTQARRVAAELRKGNPERESERQRVQLLPAGNSLPVTPQMKTAGLAMYAVLIGLILALTCASLAGLVIARGGLKAKEVAIRLSLGASRSDVVRHMLTESIVLAVAGGTAGLAAAYGMIRALTGHVSPSAGSSGALEPDLGVALLTFAIAAFAAVGFGLLPALGATRPNLVPALKGDARGGLPRRRRFGLRNFFVVAQVAVSLSLILVVGVLTIGSNRSAAGDPGFDTSTLHVFSIDPRRDGFDPVESATLLSRVAEGLVTIPGIEDATFAAQAPLALNAPREAVSVPAERGEAGSADGSIQVRPVGPRHFAALGADIVLGKDFTAVSSNVDAGGVRPAIVNQSAAEMLFSGSHPLGRRIRVGDRPLEVVAVVRYASPEPFSSKPPPVVFVPMAADVLEDKATLVMRVPSGFDREAVRRALDAIDARLSMFDARTLDEEMSELDRVRESITTLNVGIGGFALVLACVGLAGVTAQAVERRRKEIGIEMALGARWTQVLRGVMKEGAAMILCGVVLGLGVAYGLSRALIALDSQFATIIPAGASAWWLMAGTPLLITALALAACYVPARRATAVDPLRVLRAE